MKMVIITTAEEYEKKVLEMLKLVGIDNFSSSQIEGYKNIPTALRDRSWFPSERSGASSSLFFSFTETKKVDHLFELINEINQKIKTKNFIRAVELPIERLFNLEIIGI